MVALLSYLNQCYFKYIVTTQSYGKGIDNYIMSPIICTVFVSLNC